MPVSPQAYEQGLRLCLRLVLRIGVALLGLKLSITTVGMIGLNALPIVIVCIVVAIFVVSWLSRMVELPARLGSLIAVGTSICGVSAVIATGTATRADEDEISYSVAVITLFGMIALFHLSLPGALAFPWQRRACRIVSWNCHSRYFPGGGGGIDVSIVLRFTDDPGSRGHDQTGAQYIHGSGHFPSWL